MAEITTEDILAHFGVKGMKWGVRNDPGSKSRTGGSLIGPRRRTVPIVGDQGDVRGASQKVQGASTGEVASRATWYGAGGAATVLGGFSDVGSALFFTSLAGINVAALAASPTARALFTPLSISYNSSKGEIRRNTKALNKRFTNPGNDIRQNKSLQKKYNQEYEKIVRDALNRQKSGYIHPFRKLAENRVGKTSDNQYKLDFNIKSSTSEKPSVTIYGPKGFSSEFKLGRFKHDEETGTLLTTYEVDLNLDSDGLITDFSISNLEKLSEELSHSEFVDNFLVHFGVKGMRWGVRRASSSGSSSTASKGKKFTTADGRPGTGGKLGPRSEDPKKAFVKVIPKRGKPFLVEANPDAIDASQLKFKAKKFSTHTLSNKEMQQIINRMNLEAQYAKAVGQPAKKKGPRVFVTNLLTDIGSKEVTRIAGLAATIAVNQAISKQSTKSTSKILGELGKAVTPKKD